jgi:serine/threonine protein phosphatase PrpC
MTTGIAQAQPASAEIVGAREEQQDHHWIGPVRQDGEEGYLVVVCDGMGGHAGGQVASRLAVETFRDAFQANGAAHAGDRLRQALEAANAALAATAKARPELTGMGCTLIGALCLEHRLVWISVGDSLLMVAQPGGAVQRVNADHSMAPLLDRQARDGEITAAEALASDDRHVLRSALIGRKIPLIDQGEVALPAGALVIAATDGLLSLPQAAFTRHVHETAEPAALIRRVIGAIETDMAPDQDNTTMAVVRNWAAPPARQAGPGRARVLVAALLFTAVAAIAAVVALALWPRPASQAGGAAPPEAGQPAEPLPGPAVVDQGTTQGDSRGILGPAATQPTIPPKTPPKTAAKQERSPATPARKPAAASEPKPAPKAASAPTQQDADAAPPGAAAPTTAPPVARPKGQPGPEL